MLTSLKLVELLEPDTDCSELKAAIQDGTVEFRRGLQETGRILPLAIESTNQEIQLSRTKMQYLCSCYLNGFLDEIELEYVASALELCEDIVYDKNIAEALFLLATPEINGALTKEGVEQILVSLKEK